MATTQRKSISEHSSPLAPCSYAQAAKGISSTGASTAQSSKAPSDSATTPREYDSGATSTSELPPGSSWADETEATTTDLQRRKTSTTTVPESSEASVPSSCRTEDQQMNGHSGVSSPELGTSSVSTLVKEDDATSVANNSSESTWEHKSQTSNAAEKMVESGTAGAETDAEGEKPKALPKVLQEAPIPAVNIWKQRAEQAKAKVAMSATSVKTLSTTPSERTTQTPNDRTSINTRGGTRRKSKPGPLFEGVAAPLSMSRSRRTSMGASSRHMDEDRVHHGRRESRSDLGTDRSTRNPPTLHERERTTESPPLPPTRDRESWPTPESAQDEERRKTQEKSEKTDRDRDPVATPRLHGKNEWVTVPFTPTVVFNTPLPTTGARRGGRGGSRAGRDVSGRNHSGVANGDITDEKDASPIKPLLDGDSDKCERSGIPTARETSPAKGRRPDPGSLRGSRASEPSSESSIRDTLATIPNSQLAHPQSANENYVASPESRLQSLVSQKQPAISRQRQSRRYDNGAANIDRRKEADSSSPTNDNSLPLLPRDRRASITPQVDGKCLSNICLKYNSNWNILGRCTES